MRSNIGNKKKGTWGPHNFAIEDLQTMVDDYLGVDCNGFTGRYLNAKFRALKVTAQTTEEEYVSGKAALPHLRQTVGDIKADDTVVFNNGSYHHVAMVGAVLQFTAREALVILAESRTAHMLHGGPQSNIWRVRQHEVLKRAKPTGKFIEGKFNIIGRGGDTFVKIVAPERFK